MKFIPILFLGVLGLLLPIGGAVVTSTSPSHFAAALALRGDTAIMPAVQLGTPSAYYQPVTQISQVRVNSILPCVSESLHLFRFAADILALSVFHIA